jgi:hypothetical protein
MSKNGDLASIRWSSSLFETPSLAGLPHKARGVAHTNELVVLVNFVEGRTYTEILHPQHGVKWIATSSLVNLPQVD